MNALIEQSSKTYHERMQRWIDVALEEGVRFFVTSLGNPRWVVERVRAAGRRRLPRRDRAQVGREGPRRGGPRPDRGQRPRRRARGAAVGGAADRRARPASGCRSSAPAASATSATSCGRWHSATPARSSGTRFIATPECRASEAYKRAIVAADERDVVLTERLTGVPVAVLDTPSVRRLGLKAGPLARFMLRGRRTKHWMRTIYALQVAVGAQARPAARLAASATTGRPAAASRASTPSSRRARS